MKMSCYQSKWSPVTVASLCLVVIAMLVVAPSAWAQKTGRMDTPSIACVPPAGQVSLNISFSTPAPGTGAPAGFSLQWMTQADFDANGGIWFSSDDPLLCKGSFSGNAFGHYYNVPAGGSTTVQIGDAIYDNPGASSNCASDPLLCGTAYVFHAFSHANRSLIRSNWTPDLVCSTAACPPTDNGCTYTQGYWKTHGPIPTGGNSDEWPPSAIPMNLGNNPYDALQLLSIFNKPAAGNGLLTLSHQLIAAKLNIANGADGTAVAAAIAAADALIGNLLVPPVGSGSLSPAAVSLLVGTLTQFNEGTIGPGHCP